MAAMDAAAGEEDGEVLTAARTLASCIFFANAWSLKSSATRLLSAFICASDSGDASSATATAFSRRLSSASRT